MKGRYWTLALVMVVALFVATTAEARVGGKRGNMDEGGSGGCKMMGAGGGMMGEGGMMGAGGMGWKGDITKITELNLTDAQKAEAKQLRAAYQKDIYSLEDKLIAQKRQLQELLSEATPNEDKVFTLRKEMLDAKQKLSQRTLDYQQGVLKLLTKEQKEKMQVLSAKSKCGMGQYEGRAGEFGNGDSPRGKQEHAH